jgi:hypothetical protein
MRASLSSLGNLAASSMTVGWCEVIVGWGFDAAAADEVEE